MYVLRAKVIVTAILVTTESTKIHTNNPSNSRENKTLRFIIIIFSGCSYSLAAEEMYLHT